MSLKRKKEKKKHDDSYDDKYKPRRIKGKIITYAWHTRSYILAKR